MSDGNQDVRVRELIRWMGATATLGTVLTVGAILALHYFFQVSMLVATFVGSGLAAFIATVVGNRFRPAVWRPRH